MKDGAVRKRYCGEQTGGVSYWLLAGEDYDKTCSAGIGGLPDHCELFDTPPGYEALETKKYKVSADDVVYGCVSHPVRQARDSLWAIDRGDASGSRRG